MKMNYFDKGEIFRRKPFSKREKPIAREGLNLLPPVKGGKGEN